MNTRRNDPLLNVKEAAEYIDSNPGTMNNWRGQGKGPKYCKMGSNIRYKLSRLDEFVDESEVG